MCLLNGLAGECNMLALLQTLLDVEPIGAAHAARRSRQQMGTFD